MAYADLAADEKRSLQDWLQLVRPIQGEVARLLNHMGVAKTAYDSHVEAILASVVAADKIPNKSGQAGAIDVTKAELATMLSLLNNMLTTYNTTSNRELWTKFCGAQNLIG